MDGGNTQSGVDSISANQNGQNFGNVNAGSTGSQGYPFGAFGRRRRDLRLRRDTTSDQSTTGAPTNESSTQNGTIDSRFFGLGGGGGNPLGNNRLI